MLAKKLTRIPMRAYPLLILLPLFAACGREEATQANAPEAAAAQSNSVPAARIAVASAQSLFIYPQATAQAQVTSRNISEIAAQISARILALPVEPGQKVVSGAVVAKLDCRDYSIALTQARASLSGADARLKLATQQLKRSEDLAARNFISGDALDTRRTELSIAQAERDLSASQVASAQSNVGKCVLTAPFPAIVEAKPGNVGELASPGTALVRLWDLGGLEVSAQIQEKDAASLRATKTIELVTPEGRYPLQLKRISPAMSEAARTQEARLGFAGTLPKPGASGQVVWQATEAHLPADLLVTRNGKLGVFMLEANTARFMPLPQAQEGRPVAVSIDPASQIITEGRFALQDGQKVAQ